MHSSLLESPHSTFHARSIELGAARHDSPLPSSCGHQLDCRQIHNGGWLRMFPLNPRKPCIYGYAHGKSNLSH
ncbi:hypothetical protein LENED_000802 [Lentinula edodes]|uniref:Uncharacterized protein n=1 Tax=Lentinula edodes TaxID=5353 RepID=A0A1Q3DWH2_LENED|nr:hypothetical protein LENED_000802 [Lentinula edodes]